MTETATQGTGTPVPGEVGSPVPGEVGSPVPGEAVSPVPGEAVSPVPGEAVSPVPGEAVSPVPGEAVSPGDWNQFKSQLSPELSKTISKYKSFTELAQGYGEAFSLLSRRPETYSDADRRKAREFDQKVLDIPADSTGYDLKFQETGLAKEDFINDELRTIISEHAHKHKLPRGTAQDLYNLMNNIASYGEEKRRSDLKEQEEANARYIDQLWGKDVGQKFAEVEEGLKNVLPRLTGLKSEEILNGLSELPIKNHPVILQILAALGSMGKAVRPRAAFLSPVDTKLRRNALLEDAQFKAIIGNPNHPKYSESIKELMQLNENIEAAKV